MTNFRTAPLRFLLAALCVFTLAALWSTPAQASEPLLSPAALRQELRRLDETGGVLYIAAHPDDENTQLITYLARGRGYRTAYLSLTRGDGGQNVIGGEFGDALGLIRTHELLAARRIDGAQQFFTRALDFGFSKDYRETLRIWNHQQVLGDVVRVIRTFRPDVVITRFSPEPGGTHGHHTASAVLAVEAFKLAGDPTAFPEQLEHLKPWQPKRILQNGRGGGTLQLDISGVDPVLNEPFAKIAARSRAMHISQGFAGYTGSAQPRAENFQLLAGQAATSDILDGVDTSWSRYSGGAEIGKRIRAITEKFKPDDPAASVPDLLQLRSRLAALSADVVVNEKRRDLDRIIQTCLGLTIETTASRAEVVPGEILPLRHSASVQSDVPVRWMAVKTGVSSTPFAVGIELKRGQTATRETTKLLSPKMPLSQPYWLRAEPATGMARVENPQLIGLPEDPPIFPVEYVFEIGGQTFVLPTEPVQTSFDDSKSDSRRRLEVIPPVSLRWMTEVRLFAPGATRPVEVEVLAARAGADGSLRLDVPSGWKVEPPTRTFHLVAAGERAKLLFNVTAPPQAANADIAARATVNGISIETQRVEISYPHLPFLLLQPPARLKAVALDLKIRGRKVAYLPGAGDNVAQALEEMGYAVAIISGADLTLEKLRLFDAVVIGVRAFNVRADLADGLPALFDYVESGGNVIAQYNRPTDLKTKTLAPFELTLSSQRITDENAPVTFLVPDHPALNVPNKISAGDFAGWVQERGIYFPDQWAERFTPLLEFADPGEAPLRSGVLVARHGRGHFVYTGLAWFRQLPAGVPGAYRLFANLVSLGQ